MSWVNAFETIRNGHVKARLLNQIMPWHVYRNMTDDDLDANQNRVPQQWGGGIHCLSGADIFHRSTGVIHTVLGGVGGREDFDTAVVGLMEARSRCT